MENNNKVGTKNIDDLLEYVGLNFDKKLLKVIYFMQQANILESQMKVEKVRDAGKIVEKPSNCILEATYLRLCNPNQKEKNIFNDIFLEYMSFVNDDAKSTWRYNIYNLEKEFLTKCVYCNIELEYCPMKVLGYIKKCIADEGIDEVAFWDRLAGTIENYNQDKTVINNIAIDMSAKVRNMLDLAAAEFILDTEAVDIVDIQENKIKYKYLDFNIKNVSFINELNEYFSTTNGLYDEMDLNSPLKTTNYNYMFEQSPFEIAAYLKYSCEKYGVYYKSVIRTVFENLDVDEEKIAKDAFYKEYIHKVDEIDGATSLKKDLKEIFTYIRNFDLNSKLPYIQFNLLLYTENPKTVNDTFALYNSYCRAFNYLQDKGHMNIDVEVFLKMIKDPAEIFFKLERIYTDYDIIIFDNIHKLKFINEFKVEAFFIALEKYFNKLPRTATFMCGERKEVAEILKRYNDSVEKIFAHKLDIEAYDIELVKRKIKDEIKKVIEITPEKNEEIDKYVESTYSDDCKNEIDYIDKVVKDIIYYKYKNANPELEEKLNISVKKELDLTESLNELEKLTGLTEVKYKIQEIIKYIEFNKKIENFNSLNLNMIFKGNSGTGKTTVARLLGKIFYNLGICKTEKFVEVSSKDLIGDHLGQTAPKTQRVVESAMDGILFIDEAYSLMTSKGTADYSMECISTLCKCMEKNKNKVIVIFAGYTKEMNDFVNKNQGLMSRIGHVIEFEDFSNDELLEIFKNKVKDNGFELEEGIEKKVLNKIAKSKLMRNFGNARFIDNVYEQLLLTHSLNIEGETNLKTFTCNDFDVMEKTIKSEERTIDDILSELNSLTGLAEIKDVLEGFVSTLEFNKKVDMTNEFNMHMIFKGNAGTGKTTVARLLAEIYYNLGYIKKNKLVEVQSQDLIGEYVGQTGPKTQNVIESAVDGVLFIDEAYAIMQHRGTGVSYTDECIATLLKAMEDYNGRLIIIFAGYTNEMIEFRDLNPGLKSRVGFELNFEDYSVEELLEIFDKKVEAKGLKVTTEARDKVRLILDRAKQIDNFGNGRYINNMIQKIIVEHAIKTRGIEDKDRLLTIENDDINLDKLQPELSKRKIGF